MKGRILFSVLASIVLFAAVNAQDGDRADHWKKFNRHNFNRFDFSKRRLTEVQLSRLSAEGVADDFALLRGVVFGKRGRVFKERSIQDYLDRQAWYKPNKRFSNSLLTPTERANLDLIRLAEAEKHEFIEPGDMRIWEKKLITEDNLRGYSRAELSILIAEIEAIHGKTFASQEWLQRYFDERYWYKPNRSYSPAVLSDIERKNIETLTAERDRGRNTAISIGDMENFQTVPLTEELLSGLTMLELRIIREEFWARRGKAFEAPGILQYFEWRDWYKPAKNQKLVKLNKIEEKNVALIEAYEARIRERLSTEPLADDVLGEMFAEDLRVLRNEIYARRGRVFKDAALQQYFAAQPWYKADPDFKDEMLGEIEAANLVKIRSAEESAVSKFSEFEG